MMSRIIKCTVTTVLAELYFGISTIESNGNIGQIKQLALNPFLQNEILTPKDMKKLKKISASQTRLHYL
jgi:hypothetical protein